MNSYDQIYDVIIIGGGPAGLSSAIYMSRANYKTLLLEKDHFGGQITITDKVVNYPGVYSTSGKELANNMVKQAEAFSCNIKKCDVVSIDTSSHIKKVKTSIGEFNTLSIILALGAKPKTIGFTGEEEYKGRGVAYCATCDGAFFTGKPVYVIGGGFSAVEESMFLTKYADSVDIIVRKDSFSCASSVSEELKHNSKIKVNFNTEVVSIKSTGDTLDTIVLKNNLTQEEKTIKHAEGFGLFVFAGYEANTSWLKGINLNNGYIVTDDNLATNVEGVFAAGDVREKDLRQVVTAVSDGALAATYAERYASKIHKEYNIPAFDIVKKEVVKEDEVDSSDDEAFLSDAIINQLKPLFAKFENNVKIVGLINNSDLGKEIKGFLNELKPISTKLEISTIVKEDEKAHIKIYKNDEEAICFYALPGGHEFNSFIISLYNIAGPGQALSEEDLSLINNFNGNLDIKVLISLSCTMCPELVVTAAMLASKNNKIKTSIYDIAHAVELKEKYKVMSVPCLVLNDEIVSFGKKNISGIFNLL